jgi:hypothetical protein
LRTPNAASHASAIAFAAVTVVATPPPPFRQEAPPLLFRLMLSRTTAAFRVIGQER